MEEFLQRYANSMLSMREHPAKPVINSLTMIAEENLLPQTAERIVQLIETKLKEVTTLLCVFSFFGIHVFAAGTARMQTPACISCGFDFEECGTDICRNFWP